MNSQIQVYRIENAAGKGPWSATHFRFSDMWISVHRERNSGADNYPGWAGDGITAPNLDYYCACPSMTALRKWFGYAAIRKWLREHGFTLKVYATDDWKLSNSGLQLIFNKKTAKLINEKTVWR